MDFDLEELKIYTVSIEKLTRLEAFQREVELLWEDNILGDVILNELFEAISSERSEIVNKIPDKFKRL